MKQDIAVNALDQRNEATIYKAPRTRWIQRQGPFTMHINGPGHNLAETGDHGYGPLALIVESLLEPGTWIRLHQHTNDEIVSWVPAGVMRHDDPVVGELVTDPDHLMVMNSGSGFWHEERVLKTDPHLRMLQIFVRPHTADLKPEIQHGKIEPAVPGEWRLLFGPGGSDAPFYVRNDVQLYDLRLEKDQTVPMPEIPEGWHYWFYVFTGEVKAGNLSFAEGESGLVTLSVPVSFKAQTDTTLVLFMMNPEASVVKLGTVGH